MTTQSDNTAGNEIVPKLFWRLMPFLLLLYVVAYLDRINVGFAALQMQAQLHFSDAVYGLGAGIFFAGYFFFQLPSNLMLQRVGPRRWISLLMISWGIVSVSMMFVASVRSFYTLRFLLGVTEAGFFPGVILYMKSWFPAAVRGRTAATFLTAGPISGIIGGPISGWLLGMDKLHGLAGWQWLFLIEGLPAVLLGVIVYFAVEDRPESARWLSEEQRKWLLDTLRAEDVEALPGEKVSTFSAFALPSVWLLAFVYFTLNTMSYGISLWLPTVLKQGSSFGIQAIGYISTLPYLLAVGTMVLNGLHSDKTGERFWHIAVPAFAAAVALVASGHAASFPWLVSLFAIAYAGTQCMLGPFWAVSSRILTGVSAAAGIALINSVGNLGSGLGPYIIGYISTRTGSFHLALLLVGTLLGLGAAAALLVRCISPLRS